MLYSCTRMATVGVKELIEVVTFFLANEWHSDSELPTEWSLMSTPTELAAVYRVSYDVGGCNESRAEGSHHVDRLTASL